MIPQVPQVPLVPVVPLVPQVPVVPQVPLVPQVPREGGGGVIQKCPGILLCIYCSECTFVENLFLLH